MIAARDRLISALDVPNAAAALPLPGAVADYIGMFNIGSIRDRHRGQVHCRPSTTGVSMIGLRSDRPQRGQARIKDLCRLANDFDRVFREFCVDCDQGRPRGRSGSSPISSQKPNIRAMNVILASPSRFHVSCRFAADPDNFQMRERDDDDVRIVCSDPYPGTAGWSRISNGAVLTRELPAVGDTGGG